jgi:multiple antibiotic resistance protein
MESLNFADIFVTFLALLGPQKILLSFDEASRRLDPAQFRVLAVTSSVTAAAIGVLCALTAPWLTSFFHISYEAVLLAGGSIFFIYAVTVMFGLHLDAEDTGDQDEESSAHPIASGFRALALPYIVTPLGVTAVLVESLSKSGLGWRSLVAFSYVAVAALDLACVLLLGPAVRRLNAAIREVLSRLLGLLLAGVGVTIILQGLVALGVLSPLSGGGAGH